jgi:hypothetical protein
LARERRRKRARIFTPGALPINLGSLEWLPSVASEFEWQENFLITSHRLWREEYRDHR